MPGFLTYIAYLRLISLKKLFLPASPLGSPVNKLYTLLFLGLPTNEILVGGVGNC